MAITFIYAVKETPQQSLNYILTNKETVIIKKEENEITDSEKSLNYIMRDKDGVVTKLSQEYLKKMKPYIETHNNEIKFKTISTGINCSTSNAHNEWQVIRNRNVNGNKGNLQYCIVQNFGTDLDPLIANEIGVRFAEIYLKGYQCVVSTHINTGNVHNHIEFNSVSFETNKKFNDNLKAIQDIRIVSDTLCKEYGLDVLEKTNKFKTIQYKDANGVLHHYEPTNRKNDLIHSSDKNKDFYLSTEAYKLNETYSVKHSDIIKKDIDNLLPHVNDFEELLSQLRNISYDIKDKTKTGEWRKYITYKLPEWDKGVRDCAIGEKYLRISLSREIENNLGKSKNENYKDNKSNIKLSAHVMEEQEQVYQYGHIKISNIDEEYRYKKEKENIIRTERGIIEKQLIKDTKSINTEIDNIIKKSMNIPRERVIHTTDKRKQYLIDRINSNLKTLKFVENHNITSFNSINIVVSSLYEKRNAIYEQMNINKNLLKQANLNVELINKYKSVTSNLQNKYQDDIEYQNDLGLLNTYKGMLKERGLLDNDKQNQYVKSFNDLSERFVSLTQILETINRQIKEYDDCVYDIRQADIKYGERLRPHITEYYKIRKENSISSNKRDRYQNRDISKDRVKQFEIEEHNRKIKESEEQKQKNKEEREERE